MPADWYSFWIGAVAMVIFQLACCTVLFGGIYLSSSPRREDGEIPDSQNF